LFNKESGDRRQATGDRRQARGVGHLPTANWKLIFYSSDFCLYLYIENQSTLQMVLWISNPEPFALSPEPSMGLTWF